MPKPKSAAKAHKASSAHHSKKRANKRPLLHPFHVSAAAIVLLAVGSLVFFFANYIGKSSAANCTVSAKLVNSCRPWVGAAANNYPQTASDTKSQILFHEQRIGHQLDIVHTYHPVGSNKLSDTDKYFATRSNSSYLFTNWKPASKWGDASGSNASVTAGIDAMADSVKSIAPHKIFMTLHHEPENDVSGGASGCTSYKGSFGTPAQYRAMWKYVEQRFAQKGVDNVVWAMDYMNYKSWDCMVDDLYPGNDLVDWVMYNGYAGSSNNFVTNVQRFQNVLSGYQDSTHNFASKPQGIVEWGIGTEGITTSQQTAYYDQAASAIKNNTFPDLKAYMVYDSRDKGASDGSSLRVGYDPAGNYSSTTQGHYNSVVNAILNTNWSPTPPSTKDTVPPTVTLTAPADGATVSGSLTVRGNASDNTKLKAVTLRVDDKWLATDSKSPFSFTVDTTKYKDGKHSVVLRAWDSADNMAQSKTVVVTVRNHAGTKDVQSTPPTSSTTVINTNTTGTSNHPITAASTIIVSPTVAGHSIQVWVDGKLMANNVIDTNLLTNGKHTIKIVEDGGAASFKLVSVHNPFLLAALNEARLNAAAYILSFSILAAALAFWVGRTYIFGLTSRREMSVVRSQRRMK